MLPRMFRHFYGGLQSHAELRSAKDGLNWGDESSGRARIAVLLYAGVARVTLDAQGSGSIMSSDPATGER